MQRKEYSVLVVGDNAVVRRTDIVRRPRWLKTNLGFYVVVY